MVWYFTMLPSPSGTTLTIMTRPGGSLTGGLGLALVFDAQREQCRSGLRYLLFTGNSDGDMMAQCITCGTELHPERALKYDYCMAPECQEKNAEGLTMVAIGMNKAADEIMILDDRARQDLAAGKHHDQRRGTFGQAAAVPRTPAAPGRALANRSADRKPRPRPAQVAQRRAWTRSQERLALLYNEQGLKPAEIAAKLGVSPYQVSQIILSAKRG